MPKEIKPILAIMPMTPAQKRDETLKTLRRQKKRAAASVSGSLVKVMESLDEQAQNIRRAFKFQAEKDPDFLSADRVRQIIHDIMWSIPHMHLEYLAGYAAEEQEATAMLERLEQVPPEGFPVNPEEDFIYTGDKFTEVFVAHRGKRGSLEPLCTYDCVLDGSLNLFKAGGPYESAYYAQQLAEVAVVAVAPSDRIWFYTGAVGNPPMLIRVTPMPVKNEEV